jgi:hypothetical protein
MSPVDAPPSALRARADSLLAAARGSARAVLDWLRPLGELLVRWAGVAWRAVTPVRKTVGAVGWLVIAAGLLFLISGLALGWAEFVFVALTLLGALVVSAGYLFGRATYRVEVELRPHRVTVGERALGSLTVTNIAPRRSTPSRMELPVGRGVAEFGIPAMAPDEQHEELFAVPTNRRAVILAGPAMTVRGDHLGLLRRVVNWTGVVELFVHPLTARLSPSAAGLVRDLEGESTKVITDNDISFHALRPYQQGDALRNVHWRTSARVGQLMVRQYEETRRNELLLALQSDSSGYADVDEFELAVSVFASIAVQVIADGTNMTAMSEQMTLRSLSRTSLLDDSCRIELARSRFGSLRDFARSAHRQVPRPSVAMMVLGSGTDIPALRAAFTVFGEETHRVALQIVRGASPSIKVVSGITIATIGSLTELARVMSRVHP